MNIFREFRFQIVNFDGRMLLDEKAIYKTCCLWDIDYLIYYLYRNTFSLPEYCLKLTLYKAHVVLTLDKIKIFLISNHMKLTKNLILAFYGHARKYFGNMKLKRTFYVKLFN
jgi:hypothetical protein